MDEGILKIILAVISLLSAIITGVAIPYYKTRTDIAKQEKLYNMVLKGAEAAEQILKILDPDGIKRKAFVLNYLKNKGVNIFEYDVDVMIEAAVLEINKANEKLKPKEARE